MSSRVKKARGIPVSSAVVDEAKELRGDAWIPKGTEFELDPEVVLNAIHQNYVEQVARLTHEKSMALAAATQMKQRVEELEQEVKELEAVLGGEVDDDDPE